MGRVFALVCGRISVNFLNLKNLLKKVFFGPTGGLKNILQLSSVQTMYRLPPSFPKSWKRGREPVRCLYTRQFKELTLIKDNAVFISCLQPQKERKQILKKKDAARHAVVKFLTRFSPLKHYSPRTSFTPALRTLQLQSTQMSTVSQVVVKLRHAARGRSSCICLRNV